jgi:hypothetical protein
MGDLIWIGNSLYPRWIVCAAVAALPITILVIEVIVSVVQIIREARKP